MKNYLKMIVKTTTIHIISIPLSILILFWLVYAAVLWPGSAPSWESVWWKFMDYFNKIFYECPNWEVLQWYDLNKSPICTSGSKRNNNLNDIYNINLTWKVWIWKNNPISKLDINWDVRANNYCNSDWSKCLEFDTVKWDPLYINTIYRDSTPWRWYTNYNTRMINTINGQPVTQQTKDWWIDACIPYNWDFNNTVAYSNPSRFTYCWNFACFMETWIWPTMITISDMCSVNNWVDCNNNKFFISWDCLYK